MERKKYTCREKDKVKQLILAGKTYNQITQLLGVPKSTISVWYGRTLGNHGRKAVLEHLAKIRKKARIVIIEKWRKKRKEEAREISAKVTKELKNYPFNNLGFYKAMLAMLYWAEGGKYKSVTGLKFTNTDPNLTLLYVTLLRMCYNLDETKFRVRLQVHYYHSIKKVKAFWSKTLDIPLTQFTKTYIKKRSKTKRFRKNFAGICLIYYGNSKIRKELLELGLSLQKLITKHKSTVKMRP